MSPLNRAFTIESASKLIQPIMDSRGIGLTTFFNVEAVDPSAHVVESLEGEKQEYDLLVLVPPHEGAEVIKTSNLGDPGGWLPTDRATLNLSGYDNVFALGDATDLPISKSGSTAHFEAPVIASRIASLVKGTAPKTNYGGRVMCFLETGDGKATALRFDYEHPPMPPKPNRAWHVAKWLFNRLYWETVPQGRLPERAPFTTPEGGPIMSTTIAKTLDLRGLVLPAADREDRTGDPRLVGRRPDRGRSRPTPAPSPTSPLGARRPGNELVERTEDDGVYRFVIRKAR